MCRSQNVGSYEEAGEVSYTELQKGHEDLCRKETVHVKSSLSSLSIVSYRIVSYLLACEKG